MAERIEGGAQQIGQVELVLLAAGEIADRIEPVIEAQEHELVRPAFTLQIVQPGPANNGIIARPTVELVIAGAAIKLVRAAITVDIVIACAAIEPVLARPAINLVAPEMAKDEVIDPGAVQHIIHRAAVERPGGGCEIELDEARGGAAIAVAQGIAEAVSPDMAIVILIGKAAIGGDGDIAAARSDEAGGDRAQRIAIHIAVIGQEIAGFAHQRAEAVAIGYCHRGIVHRRQLDSGDAGAAEAETIIDRIAEAVSAVDIGTRSISESAIGLDHHRAAARGGKAARRHVQRIAIGIAVCAIAIVCQQIAGPGLVFHPRKQIGPGNRRAIGGDIDRDRAAIARVKAVVELVS